jgi:DNA invertase Pin-like site-specific DNA recombinase
MAQNTGKFVAYYRVSTGWQGRSGLGLEAQREAVKTYLNGGDWEIVDQHTEIGSGKRSDRPPLRRRWPLQGFTGLRSWFRRLTG